MVKTAMESAPVTSQPNLPSRSLWPSRSTWLWLLGLALVIAVALWLNAPKIDAYSQSVLSLEGSPSKGRSIFVMNCVACHGQWATGEVGPSLKDLSSRKSNVQVIQQVVSGKTPPMPQFQPAPQEMADLLSYLRQL